ncbi:MAG: helix-turn-helix domain-containing protein [Lachnospiraceae bacterium]|nr:helix-turn-helix domain-containing protein [Lachnospiraceae bacterium]
MITKQVIQTCIDQLKEFTKVDFALVDTQGILVANNFESDKPDVSMMVNFFDSPADSQIIGGNYLFKVMEENEPAYVLVSHGSQSDGYVMGKIAVSQLEQLLVAYKEQFDHSSFIQNLLLDNLLLVDIYNRAKKLGIPQKARRVVFMIEVSAEKGNEALHAVKTAFSEKMDDYAIAVEENAVILVHTLEDDETYEDMRNIAAMLQDLMNTEVMLKARVSYGTIVEELREISKSYKEAGMAMDVGKIFYNSDTLHAYDSLGIGRLIYQLPANLCKLFIDEIYGEEMPKEVDEEILHTAEVFLENNLNVSETARQLYIHRNTLVYRIEKLKAATGLDVRIFDDALTFKIATMVSSYIQYIDRNDL